MSIASPSPLPWTVGRLAALGLMAACQSSSPGFVAVGAADAGLARLELAPPTRAAGGQERPAAGGSNRPSDVRAAGAREAPAAVDLTLDGAVTLALQSHPALWASEQALDAQYHDLQQSRRLLNPSFRVDLENFAGSGTLSAFDAAETTLWLEQRVEPPGRRRARRRVGEAGMLASAADRDRTQLEVTAWVEAAFVRALAAERALGILAGAEASAAELGGTVAQLVAAGKVAALEGQKATIALAAARSARVGAERALAAARVDLEYALGGEQRVGRLLGELDVRAAPEPVAELRARAGAGPWATRWSAELERSEAEVALAGAARTNLDVAFALRRLSATDDTAAVVSVGVPLRVFDRRRDAVRAARARKARVGFEQQRAELELLGRLEQAWARQSSTFEELRVLEQTLLPRSQEAVANVTAGYRAGKFELIEVFDTRRTLAALRSRRIAALREHRLAAIEIRSIVGDYRS